MYQDLEGKTAVVTGSGKKTGIGYAIAQKLAESGANVVIADLVKADDGNPLVLDKIKLTLILVVQVPEGLAFGLRKLHNISNGRFLLSLQHIACQFEVIVVGLCVSGNREKNKGKKSKKCSHDKYG